MRPRQYWHAKCAGVPLVSFYKSQEACLPHMIYGVPEKKTTKPSLLLSYATGSQASFLFLAELVAKILTQIVLHILPWGYLIFI